MGSEILKNSIRSRSGWSESEIGLFRDTLTQRMKSGSTLQAVFEEVAHRTGRKPNSVRNYYYTVLKGTDIVQGVRQKKQNGFTPFASAEIRQLLRRVLTARANGVSVRACTMEMGVGDKSAMLRYQNKYRSLIASHRDVVVEVMEGLSKEKIPYYDPYANTIVDANHTDVQTAADLRDKRCSPQELRYMVKNINKLAQMAVRGENALMELEKLHKELRYQWQISRYYKERLQEMALCCQEYLKTGTIESRELLERHVHELEGVIDLKVVQ